MVFDAGLKRHLNLGIGGLISDLALVVRTDESGRSVSDQRDYPERTRIILRVQLGHRAAVDHVSDRRRGGSIAPRIRGSSA